MGLFFQRFSEKQGKRVKYLENGDIWNGLIDTGNYVRPGRNVSIETI